MIDIWFYDFIFMFNFILFNGNNVSFLWWHLLDYLFASFVSQVAGDPGRKDETMSREYHLHPDSVGDVVSIPSAARDEYFEEDDDDGWGGFGSSGGGDDDDDPMNDDGFSDRTSSIRRMLEEEDDDDEDNYGSDEEDRGGGSLPYYDRSPGEVYTIPEEEEDMTSPSMVTWDGELNPDTASSLLRWRGTDNPNPKQQNAV